MGSAPGAPAEREIVLTDEFRQALALLAGGKHLFLTGKAGTGKSTLIRRFMAETDRNVVVVAPTGIAALNVDGYTIHRLFGFRATTSLHDVRGGSYRPGRFTKTLASLHTLIVDEASMVRADVFDMLAAALERFGPQPGAPFGGVQIVLVGDLYQLPPVVGEGETAFFSTTYDTPYFFSANSFERDDFPTVSLTTVFRQLGDDRMTAILNEIREGVLLGHAQEQLNARADADFVPPDDEFWMTLAPTNRLVTARNRQQLERLPGDELIHHAKVSGDLSLFDPPVEETLRFKVGAQVMMLNNDQGDRWVNGTIGRVIGVDYDRYGAVVEVEFADGSCADVTPYAWEATRPVVSGGSLSREVIGSYTQLPFKLAWAITIHKAQGQTLERLVVDLSGGMFSTGQLYVALSRCTSLAGLVLKRPVLPKDLKTDRRIARFLRSSVDDGGARRYCAIGMLTVGDEGRMSRPRPVELAVAFDDGTAVTTLINPQRDLADARTAFGINVSDVLLAPTLREAWAVIAPMLAGCTPVGAGIDETLGLIDFELKRLGYVTAMPLGVELRGARVSGRTALERAQSALAAHGGSASEEGSSAFEEPEPAESISGLLVSRDHSVQTPAADHLPGLSALLRVSRDVAAVLLGGRPSREGVGTSWDAAARQSVADQLRTAASRVQLPVAVVDRLREASRLLGVEIVAESMCLEGDDIGSVLTPGVRICFTGTAQDGAGRIVEREEMEQLAASAGLKPVKSVTKTRCEVLVTAEAGTQSGKARKAREYGKPVFTADEFLAWLRTFPRTVELPDTPSMAVPVIPSSDDDADCPWSAREAELLAVTLELLQEHGYDRLTLDAVATTARASKATLYRRWPTKAELVMAAFIEGTRQVAVDPDTGTLRGDLLALGEQICAHVNTHAGTIRAVLVEISRNAELDAIMQEQFLAQKKALMADVLAQAVDRGEIEASAITEDLWDVLPGYLIFRSVLTGRPPTSRTVRDLVDNVLIPSLTRHSAGRE